jgi:3alpha(or 20beta)-hydroxysteroid dehydrogenase
MGRLDGKVAFISRGARDLGPTYARFLAAEGANVVIGDTLESEGKKIAKDLGSHGCYVTLDVTESSDWIDAVEIAEHTFGPLGILINNAGIVNYVPFDEYTNQQFGEIMEVNLFGTFYGMKTVIPSMKKAGRGSIINISSFYGRRETLKAPGYIASKWGVRGLTKSAALDLAKYNIRVNSIYPGQILAPTTRVNDLDTGHVAMNRAGKPEELANIVLFLAGDESGFITGADIAVDGGESAGLADWG